MWKRGPEQTCPVSESQSRSRWLSCVREKRASVKKNVTRSRARSSSHLGIAELMVPIGAFFSCSNTCLIPHYRRVFPKCESDPFLELLVEQRCEVPKVLGHFCRTIIAIGEIGHVSDPSSSSASKLNGA